MGWVLRGWFAAVIVGLGIVTAGGAQASVNLPLHHWTYDAIERLVALGIINRAMIVPKPYSRKEAAKYVARGVERVRTDRVPMDGRETIAEPLLYRLMQEFRPELIELGVMRPPHLTSPPLGEREKAVHLTPPPLGEREKAVHLTSPPLGERERGAHLTSPPLEERNKKRIRESWRKSIRYGGRVNIEADAFFVERGTVRFRENRRGEYYSNGEYVQTDLRGWIELTDAVALSAQPKVVSNDKLLGIGANANDKNVWFQELNAKFSLFNIAFEVGRGTLWWGPGYHGSLLLTDHAFPLDMFKLGSDEPFRLPWVFGSLGEWKVNTFLTQLERNRDFPRAHVFGLRVSYLSSDWLELGFTRLTQFNGRGRGQSFPEAVLDAYGSSPNQGGDRAVNEQVMVDFRAGVPRVPYLIPFPAGLQLYGELGSEDKWSKYPIPSRAAFLTGIYVPQVFRGGSLDLRIEYADSDFTRRKTRDSLEQIWYSNGTYKSGMRFRGFPLGPHMGTDAIDLFVRTTRYLSEDLQLGSHFNWQERDRGQPAHETKREVGADLTWWPSNRMQLRFGYTHQRIKNPGQITSINPFEETFAVGVTSNNHLLWTNLSYQF